MLADPKFSRKIASGLIILKKIVEGTSDKTGEPFFRVLVKNLAESLDAHGVWVTEILKDANRLRSLAFWLEDHFVEEYEYDIPGTPCEVVLKSDSLCHIPENVIDLYPDDPDLPPLNAVSYMGIALRDNNGELLGHLALLDNKPMAELPEAYAVFKIFASRAAAELRRMIYEKKLIENEEKLKRLVNGTNDCLIEFNDNHIITQANRVAEVNFIASNHSLEGKSLDELFDSASYRKIIHAINRMGDQRTINISSFNQNYLNCISLNGQTFPAEATISRYSHNKKKYHALILRNVSEKIKAQQEIMQLNTEAILLREKVSDVHFETIIGESPQLLKALKAVGQVAVTDSTVLLRGETGTGKELFAMAIHKTSSRRKLPMVSLNCAALPSDLIESELFGHVKGAFTGAATSREGRFKLANGSTLFLDEIGELPLTLQAKLLRVLQEGEFEPVGSSKTVKVNVRVIAATNRDLEREIDMGRFRMDLYYRLNVFPVDIPPLRDRGNDIILLAEAFIQKFSKKYAFPVIALNDADKHRLLSYSWPGNVRELQNVIERCIIISQDGKNHFQELLPGSFTLNPQAEASSGQIYTEGEMMEIERQNILRALKLTHWKISGNDGAAALLQIPATTLSSRIAKLNIKRE